MRKLGLSGWASLAEIAGTVAVVISLLFVAFSVERNTAAVSGQNADDMYDAIRTIDLTVLSNPDLMMVTIRGSVDIDSLSELETEQYKSWVGLYLDIWQRLYFREKDGLIQSDTVIGWHEYFTAWAKRNLPRSLWETIRWQWATSGFGGLVDEALSD
jgi:hypothetical protein